MAAGEPMVSASAAAVATAADLNANDARGSSRGSSRAEALHRVDVAFFVSPILSSNLIPTLTPWRLDPVAMVAIPPELLVPFSLNDAPSGRCGRAVTLGGAAASVLDGRLSS